MIVNSLKEDMEPYKNVLWFDDGNLLDVRFYETGHAIDCYHRLKLTPEDLRKLLKIARLEKMADKAVIAGDEEGSDRIHDELDKEHIEFHDKFVNPYRLDIDNINEDRSPVAFLFYDYDYDYYLIHSRNGWYTYCTESNSWGDGLLCECDQPSLLI